MLDSRLFALGRGLFWAALAFWIPVSVAFLTIIRFSRPLQRLLPLWVAEYWYLAMVVGVLVASAAYCVAVLRNGALSVGAKAVWILGILLFGPIFCPIYWWHSLRVRS
jgi:hypothetical protein